jgi:chromate reductase
MTTTNESRSEGGTTRPPDRRPVRLLIFSASLREGSLNTKLAALAARAIEAQGGEADVALMRDFDCSSYDMDVQDRDGFPPGADNFRARLLACDGFVISSPEYNASMPGVLKNAIDWVSRYQPQPFNERHGLLMSASPSMSGGNRGLWALRVPLEHLGVRLYPDMFSLAQAHLALDGQGQIGDERLRDRFDVNIANFLDLVEASKHYPCVKRHWVEYLGEHPEPALDRVEGPPR